MGEKVEGQAPENDDVQYQITAMQEQLERLQSNNERLLEESKRYKSVASQKADELEAIQKQKLQESGKLEELLEMERNKAHEASVRAKQLERETMKRALEFEVANRAKDAFDVRDILGSINPDIVSYDETNGSFKGVDDALNEVRAKKPYLFNANTIPATPDGRPSAQIPKEETVDERIARDPKGMLGEVLKDYLSN